MMKVLGVIGSFLEASKAVSRGEDISPAVSFRILLVNANVKPSLPQKKRRSRVFASLQRGGPGEIHRLCWIACFDFLQERFEVGRKDEVQQSVRGC